MRRITRRRPLRSSSACIRSPEQSPAMKASAPLRAGSCPTRGTSNQSMEKPRPLHQLTHRPGHTLIALGGPRADPHWVAALTSELERRSGAAVDAVLGFCTQPADEPVGRIDESIAARLGVVDITVLGVRPDRYIGLRDDRGDPQVVEAYLRALLS
jgi:hypothetical protein